MVKGSAYTRRGVFNIYLVEGLLTFNDPRKPSCLFHPEESIYYRIPTQPYTKKAIGLWSA